MIKKYRKINYISNYFSYLINNEKRLILSLKELKSKIKMCLYTVVIFKEKKPEMTPFYDKLRKFT